MNTYSSSLYHPWRKGSEMGRKTLQNEDGPELGKRPKKEKRKTYTTIMYIRFSSQISA